MRILRFTADWCGPCKKIAPVLDQIQREHDDLQIEVVDIDTVDGKAMARKWNITGVPTLVRVDDDGNQIAALVGAHPKGKIVKDLGLV